ncbi:hypothetical protein ABW19_dt0201657 [Dactylella cylindrospora]|nr:hypothetical protein ABW19_dt0201657 [Dactylella cylindrospora]
MTTQSDAEAEVLEVMNTYHPLVQHETLTLVAIHGDEDRKNVSYQFEKAMEFQYLGQFDQAYKVLEEGNYTSILKSKSASYWYLYGTIKFQHGYYRDGRTYYGKAQKLLRDASDNGRVLSDGSKQLLDLIDGMLLLAENEAAGGTAGQDKLLSTYREWAQQKEPDELDSFSLRIEDAYYIVVKDSLNFEKLAEVLLPRYLEILKTQIPKGNAVIVFPIFLNVLNKTPTYAKATELKNIMDKLLNEAKAPANFISTVDGYLATRLGQLSNDPDQQKKHFKEARKHFKAAGNAEAPCELDLLDCLVKGQAHILNSSGTQADLMKRILHTIDELGKLYSKFTQLNLPNRMNAVLKNIANMNDKMVGSNEIKIVTCKMWRLLGKATGAHINSATEFVAVVADIMKTDDLEDSLRVCEKFKAETESQWDTNLRVAYLRTVAAAHYRTSMYDEAIAEMEEAKTLLRQDWRYSDSLDFRDQILAMKERRIHTLSKEEAGYAFDDLLEEIDEATKEEGDIPQRLKQWVEKKIWKAMLLVANPNLVPIEKMTVEAGALLEDMEKRLQTLSQQDSTFKPYAKRLRMLKVMLLQAQGKLDAAAALAEKGIPSKWNPLKKLHDAGEDVEEVKDRMLVVTVYIKSLTEEVDKMDKKTLEHRTKVCLGHLKEILKLGEKHNLAGDYCDALYFEAICHLALENPLPALQNLVRASILADEIRRAAPKSDRFDGFISNAVTNSETIGGLASAAIKACLKIPNAVSCWWWIQTAKARAFSDLMRLDGDWSDHFTRVTDDIENLGSPWEDVSINFSQLAMLYRLDNLMKDPIGFTLDNWDEEEMQRVLNHRKQQIRELMDQIEKDPEIRGALTVSRGLPATHEDMTWLANYRRDENEIIFIDWAKCYDQLIISIYTPGGMIGRSGFAIIQRDAEIRLYKVPLSLKQVHDWADEYLKDQDMPLESENAFDDLDILNGLIEPIIEFSKPSDLLVLSPTDVLHTIPLHALKIGQKENGERLTLIERNPVVYIPSFSIMRQCVARLRLGRDKDLLEPGLRQSTLIGIKNDYGEEDPAVLASLSNMAHSLDGQTFIGDECDLETFKEEAANTTDILHFHGHMDYSDPRPLHRYLVLGEDEKITARQLADLKFPEKTAPLVSIIACLSGGQQIMTGDEPIGIIPALMAAGAASVIATFWPTDSDTGLEFAELLYEDRRQCDERDKIWNIAKGVQKAVVEIMGNEETKAPYYWASFGLHGAWLRGTGKTGTLPRGDGLGGLTERFSKGFEIRF